MVEKIGSLPIRIAGMSIPTTARPVIKSDRIVSIPCRPPIRRISIRKTANRYLEYLSLDKSDI